MEKIWAVVLAAGESSRMMGPKLTMPFVKMTMIEDVVRNILSSGLKNITVVTGAWEDEVLAALSGLDVRHCRNENYRNGMLSSVITGISSLPENTEAAIIFQGDQPGISSSVVTEMIDTFRNGEKGIVIPLFRGRRGHPLLVSQVYFLRIRDLDPEKGLKGLLPAYSMDIAEVEVADEKILRDIDNIEDYKKAVT